MAWVQRVREREGSRTTGCLGVPLYGDWETKRDSITPQRARCWCTKLELPVDSLWEAPWLGVRSPARAVGWSDYRTRQQNRGVTFKGMGQIYQGRLMIP